MKTGEDPSIRNRDNLDDSADSDNESGDGEVGANNSLPFPRSPYSGPLDGDSSTDRSSGTLERQQGLHGGRRVSRE